MGITAPRLEGTVRVRAGRKLGIAEFGTPDGQPVVWFHGTPGARRQVPEEARKVADARGLRIVGIDRPGVGLSTPHQYEDIFDFVGDLEIVVDQLGIERFAGIALSGGAPYAMAAAAGLPGRVPALGILGGVVPSVGPDAPPGGWVGFAKRFRSVMPLIRHPSGVFLTAAVRLLKPLGPQALQLYARVTPPGDREVLTRPDVSEMFLDDLTENGGRSMRALLSDGILFTREWGFEPHEIDVPIWWWHGDADNIVPLSHAEWFVPRLKHAELFIRPGESHLGGLGIATEVLDHVTRW
jgi:pimeloyl-ACP methyl ester carboxylesterase